MVKVGGESRRVKIVAGGKEKKAGQDCIRCEGKKADEDCG